MAIQKFTTFAEILCCRKRQKHKKADNQFLNMILWDLEGEAV